ncbi:unnamed protein product [Mytilus edulis]|uniref:Uncharacterized protein n=1 Tax=Mytilus edulis TaxID=6550 RepID=A0A8S3QVK4_MYTED|nr:unnamed protein product [Mytilus edulis]
MESRKIVFVDNINNRLIIFNEYGLFDCEKPVSRHPVDVTCIDANTIVVTHNAEPYHIEIINIRNKKMVKMIKTSYFCYGITNYSGRLIYYETGSGIQTVDITDESSVTTVVKVEGEHHWNYVTKSKDKIYRTDQHSRTAKCYKVTGRKNCEYKNKSMLSSTYGVTIDNDSNVYVASREITVSSYFQLMFSTSVVC